MDLWRQKTFWGFSGHLLSPSRILTKEVTVLSISLFFGRLSTVYYSPTLLRCVEMFQVF